MDARALADRGLQMFGKLVNLFRRQQAPAKKPVEVPLSIKANDSHEKTDMRRSGVFGPGRPISKQPPPKKPGHYRIVRKKTGELRYYGTAQDLLLRKANHQKSQKFKPNLDDFLWQPAKDGVSAHDLYEYEKKKIKKHKPRLNRNSGGGGRRWPAKPASNLC